MKKTIWIPLILGVFFGLLDFAIWAVDFAIPLGPWGASGPQEVFIIMSAALGGPLGLFVTCLFYVLGDFAFSVVTLFSPEQLSSMGVLYSIANFSAHILAALPAAYCYKFFHQRVKKVYVFFGSWILILVFYYFLLVTLQFFLVGLVVEMPPLFALYRYFLPELMVTGVVTTLIWIALPMRFNRPQWIEPEPVPQPIKEGIEHKETQI
jgi:hypothetical protein